MSTLPTDDLEKGLQTNEAVAPNDKNFPHCKRHPRTYGLFVRRRTVELTTIEGCRQGTLQD